MSKKQIITIISIVVTLIIISVATVLIINKNNITKKTSVTGQNINDNENIIEETIVAEETLLEETPSKSPTPTTSPTPYVPKGAYYIKVNNEMNTVTIYTKDANGAYTVPVKAMVCSTGYSTPKNSKYKIQGRWNWGLMFGGVYTQYETLITGNILFHSVPYLRKYDPSSLEWWLYDKLGTTCSAGCVRLTVKDAKWIYENIPTGTTVEFYSSADPGPLGKPSAMKISGYDDYLKNWDPTDPDPNNPWIQKFIEDSKPSTPEITPETTKKPVETLEPIVPTIETTVTQTPIVVPSVEPTENSVATPTSTVELSQTSTATATSTATPTATTMTPTPTATTQPTETPTVEPTTSSSATPEENP